MTTEGRNEAPEEPSLLEALLDAFVYAPIGLALDARDLTPDLARRGRQHTAAARQIGELAVKASLRRLEDALAQDDEEPSRPTTRTARTAAEPTVATTEPEGAELDHAETDLPIAELAIPDYDLLAASQVVKRLDALSPDELEAVRVYEAATRDRRTILHKIARLQD